jgi:hypothetical protein
LLAFLNDVFPFSITFMASSKASLVHLALVLATLHLLTFLYFFVDSNPRDETIFLSYVDKSSIGWSSTIWFYSPLHFLQGTFNTIML